MKTILLPTDFSDNSWNAIAYALRFFENTPCTFYIHHVNSLGDIVTNNAQYIGTTDVLEQHFTKPTKKKLNQLLRRIATELPSNKAHHFHTVTDINFFIESIRKQVQEKRVDLIVMGTKGASGFKKLILGSNTGDLITKVHCNTLIIPENARYTKLTEVAFPTDFSQFYGMQVLQPLLEILEEFKPALRVLYIAKKDSKLNSGQEKNKDFLEDYLNSYPHSFHYLTNEKVERAVQCFVESRTINMIAMVAKNLNYFQQILFHSKVKEISYQTEIPFLVLHE